MMDSSIRINTGAMLSWSLLCLSLVSNSQVEGENGRIIRGNLFDPRNKYPMLVRVKAGRATCGGTILDKIWVITTASCVSKESIENITITAGDYDQYVPDGTEQVVGAVEVIMHENARLLTRPYHEVAFPNNIALIRVHPPFIFNKNVVPTNPPEITYFMKENSETQIVGWGRILHWEDLPGRLREATLKLRKLADCQDYYEDFLIPDSHLCAGYPGDPGGCAGDEGGPLLLYEKATDSFTQLGLNSYINCDYGPDLLVNLVPYLFWMKHQVSHQCKRRRVVWCSYGVEYCKPWQCCDKLPKRFVALTVSGAEGSCQNRTFAKNCMS